MILPYQLISVFTNSLVNARGNISAVVWTEDNLPGEQMQQIAGDLGQPATTFISRNGKEYLLRWFAPDAEIGLCGHGTAAACVARALRGEEGIFDFIAGNHAVQGTADAKNRTFDIKLAAIPSYARIRDNGALEKALGLEVIEHYGTDNKNVVLVKSESELRHMKPSWHLLRKLPAFGYSVTAPADPSPYRTDFVSRTLVPKVAQLEDHATGSSHAALVPYWAAKLMKNDLYAKQLSARGGWFKCRLEDEEVKLSGQFELLAEGKLFTFP